jgi:serine/threonine protein kinase
MSDDIGTIILAVVTALAGILCVHWVKALHQLIRVHPFYSGRDSNVRQEDYGLLISESTQQLEVAWSELQQLRCVSADPHRQVLQGKLHGSVVTVQMLPLAASREGRAGLETECDVLFTTRHPCLVLFMGFTWAPHLKQFGLLSPYMPRGSLSDVLASGVNLPWRQRITMLMDVARAVAFLHQSGHVHGAIRSGSVLVDEEYRVKLGGDFGHGRFDTRLQTVTHADVPIWSAPEVIRGSAPTVAADLYSLGMLIWEVFVGHHD